jgi:hypothetical protein
MYYVYKLCGSGTLLTLTACLMALHCQIVRNEVRLLSLCDASVLLSMRIFFKLLIYRFECGVIKLIHM